MRATAAVAFVRLLAFSICALASLWQAPVQAQQIDAEGRTRDREFMARVLTDPRPVRDQAEREIVDARRAGDVHRELMAIADCATAVWWMTPKDRTLFRDRLEPALKAARESGDREALFRLLEYQGFYLASIFELAQATEAVTEAASIAKAFNDSGHMARVELLLGQLSLNGGKFADAVAHYSKAIDFGPHDLLRAELLGSMAVATFASSSQKADREDVLRLTKEAIALADPDRYPTFGIQLLLLLGQAEAGTGDSEAAVRHLKHALELEKVVGRAPSLSLPRLVYAQILTGQHRPGEALAALDSIDESDAQTFLRFNADLIRVEALTLKADALGIKWLERAAELLPEVSMVPRNVERYHRDAVDLFTALGRYKDALDATRALIAATKDRNDKANEQLRLELQTRFDVKAKEGENALLRANAEAQQVRRQVLTWGIATIGLIAVAALVLLVLQIRQRRRLAELSTQLTQRNEDLTELGNSRTRLLAAACHDLRQPAHALGLLAELADRDDASTAARAAQLQSIRRCSATLTDMLSELMDMTRLEGGHYVPEISTISLDELVRETQVQFVEVARRKGLELRIALPDEDPQAAPLTVSSDRHLLRRILFNLVTNAVKYTDRGSVVITARREGDSNASISVQDTGVGIAPDRLDDVFQDYVRLDARKSPDGLGIGLSIVKRAADLLGHSIKLDSTVGLGTTVMLTLPLAQAGAPAAAASSEAAMQGEAGKCVALLENDLEARQATAALLRHWGYRVIEAGSSEELKARFASEQLRCPDLLITDLHLNRENGLEQVPLIRAWPDCAALPVLLITGDLDSSVTLRAASLNVLVGHKPMMPRRLMLYIQEAQRFEVAHALSSDDSRAVARSSQAP